MQQTSTIYYRCPETLLQDIVSKSTKTLNGKELRLTKTDLFVFLALESFLPKTDEARRKRGDSANVVFPCQEKVAEMLRMTREAVSRSTTRLEAFGYIAKIPRKYTSGMKRRNEYEILVSFGRSGDGEYLPI